MLALILVEAGPAPVVPHRRRRQRDRHQCASWDSGEWIVVEADESDGTFLHLVPDIAVVTNVEADHLDHYGSFDAVRDGFVEFLGLGRSSGWSGSDDAEARAIGQAAGRRPGGPRRRRHPSDRPPWPRAGARSPSTCSGRTGPWSPTCRSPCPGSTTPRTPRWPRWPPWPPVPMPVRRPGRWPGSGAWPGASSSGASSAGSPSSTTTPTCPPRCAAALAAARNGAWGRVVAVFQPHRYTRTAEVAADFGRRVRRRRRGGDHRRLRRRRGSGAGGVRPAGGRRRAPGPARRSSCTTCRAGPTWWARWPTLLMPGRPVPDPRRRRPDLAARRADGGRPAPGPTAATGPP